jgi:acetone carboxylase gamma subunit
VDFKKLQKQLKTVQDKYTRAKEVVLKLKQKLHVTESQSPPIIQKCICNYISTIQKILVLPTKEIIEAQELLKLLWNLCVKNDNVDIYL